MFECWGIRMGLAANPPRVAAGCWPFLEERLCSGPCGAAICRGQFRAEWGPAQSEQEWTKRQRPALKLRQISAPGALVEVEGRVGAVPAKPKG